MQSIIVFSTKDGNRSIALTDCSTRQEAEEEFLLGGKDVDETRISHFELIGDLGRPGDQEAFAKVLAALNSLQECDHYFLEFLDSLLKKAFVIGSVNTPK